MLTAELEQAKTIMDEYREDPITFFTNCLDVKPQHIWPKMTEVAESVRDNQKTAVKAGHSVSKTYTASRLVLWFLLTHYPATVITTAPTHMQVEEVLWREIHDAFGNAKVPIGGELTKTKLDLDPKWFALGFSTRPDTVTKQATRFQGYHNEHVLVIFDEAAGIMKEIWEAVDSLMATGNCRILAIGNPTTASGEFPKCFRDATYNKITIAVQDTPNFKEGKEVIPGLSGRKYEADTARKYGKESNYYKARVLGEIPEEDVDTIISVAAYDKAIQKRITHRPPFRRFIAGDPADGGDESVFFLMEETDIKDKLIFRKKNVISTAGRVNIFAKQHKVNFYAGDCIGIGKGVSDALDSMGMDVLYVNYAERHKSGVPELYYNRRSQIWSQGGEMFNDDEIDLNYEDELLKEQLTSVKQMVRSGQILIQDKDQIRKDYGWSSDRADAYLIGLYALPFVPCPKESDWGKRHKKAKKSPMSM